jgi:hypothetical protein
MTRTHATAALAALAAALLALPLAAVAQDAPRPVSAAVAPHAGHRQTTFRVSFTARDDTRPDDNEAYVAIARKAEGARCDRRVEAEREGVFAGDRVRIALTPDRRWCRGHYRGTIVLRSDGCFGTEGGGVHCDSGDPVEYVVGRFAFRVR